MNLVPAVYYLRILPEIVLTVFAVAIMLIEAPARGGSRGRQAGWVAFIGSLAALAATWVQMQNPGYAFHHLFLVDGFTVFFDFLLIAAVAVIVLLSMDYLAAQNLERGEFYALLLFAAVGMTFMVGSVELIMIFLSLEISSIATYILAGYRRDAPRSTEASLKYFLLGSFATAFFLYGIALVYGATGSVQLEEIASAVRRGASALAGVTDPSRIVLLGAALMFVGLGFKVSAAPFQIWTPDVYEGAPAAVTAFLATAPKAAAFAIFLRIFYVALQGSTGAWFWMIWVAAILSMTIGNVAALLQNNMKRMLAYSSIAHAGYVLVAFAALGTEGLSAVMFYLAAYVAMNIGAFAVIAHFGQREERYTDIHDYAGLGFRFPVPAVCLSLFLFSLIGVPLTGGFFGKLYIFRAALDSHLVALTIIGVLNSALAAYYYLRVIVFMYMRPAEREVSTPATSGAFNVVMAVCALVVIWLGVFPNGVLQYAAQSAKQLLRG